MDFSKVDRMHETLRAQFMVTCTEEEATPYEALTVAMRMFSHFLAAYVSGTEVVHTSVARDAAIDTYCHEAAALAKTRLLLVGEDTDPQ